MTQHQLITAHINTFGSITPMEAFGEYGITKLATRISELRRQGVQIHGEMVSRLLERCRRDRTASDRPSTL